MLAAIPIAEASAFPLAKPEAPVVPLPVAIGFAHHCGRAFLELVHANGEIAQYILVEALLSLDLVECGGRRVDIEHREMRLAILAQTVRQGPHPPLLGLRDLATLLLDDALDLRGELLDLLRANKISVETALSAASNPADFRTKLALEGGELEASAGEERATGPFEIESDERF